jgi:hypothetical protein
MGMSLSSGINHEEHQEHQGGDKKDITQINLCNSSCSLCSLEGLAKWPCSRLCRIGTVKSEAFLSRMGAVGPMIGMIPNDSAAPSSSAGRSFSFLYLALEFFRRAQAARRSDRIFCFSPISIQATAVASMTIIARETRSFIFFIPLIAWRSNP